MKRIGNMRLIDLTGQVFGRLSVLERAENSSSKMTRWKCICTCGNVKVVQAVNLKTGQISSCGCLRRELRIKRLKTHGMSGTPEHVAWAHMTQRCLNPRNKSWDDYGGRGIKVSPEWYESFEQFYQDMGPRPEGMSLERLDVNGHYCKGNCVWATPRTQAQNKRNNVLSWDKVNALWKLREDGAMPIEIAKKLGLSLISVRSVLYQGHWKKD